VKGSQVTDVGSVADGAPGEPAGSDLARAGAKGTLWQGAAFVLGKGIVLVTTVLLARVLAPEQFGLVSLALVLIAYAEAVADVGVAQALVYLPRATGTTRAAVLCSLGVGALLVLLGLAAAPAIADFFGRDDVTPLVRLLALSLLTSAGGAVPEALLRRALLFHRLTVAAVVRAVATGAVSIVLALAGYGAWALAWGTLAGSAAYALAAWLLLPERPDVRVWRATRPDLRTVLAYGVPVAGGALLAKLLFDVDYLVVGHLEGAEALGFYTLAFRIPELLIINVFFVISSVTFPLYSRARSDGNTLRRGYLFSVRIQSLYGVCAGVGIAATAHLLVPLVFGDAWRPAVGPLVALAIYAAFRSLGAGANEVYKAMGRPGLSVTVSLVRLAILVPALVLATRWGVSGVAWAQAATSLLFVLLTQGVACRVLHLPGRALLADVSPALLCGAAVAVVASSLARLPLPPVLALALAVVGGILAAAGILLLGYRAMVRELLQVLFPARRSPVPHSAGA